MSDAMQESLFEQLKQQHAQFVAQRDQIQINFQQLAGAIAVCEMMIKTHEEKMKKQVAVTEKDCEPAEKSLQEPVMD